MMRVETALILFEFITDNDGFRLSLFAAIDEGRCPDFSRSFGGSTSRTYSALWRPEDAPAVRAWADSVGATLQDGDIGGRR